MPPSPALVSMQGIGVPQSSVQPELFARTTRRETIAQRSFNFGGLGQTDNVPILQTGILSSLSMRVSGQVVVALGGGTCASLTTWPYGLVKNARFSANGQSNLVQCGGPALKARAMMSRGDLSDRGVAIGANGAAPGLSTNQGTLKLASEAWGKNTGTAVEVIGNNVTAIPSGTYGFDLHFEIPIAADPVSLTGAIFAQTASTDLNLSIDWAPITELFALTGAATATLTCSVVVTATVFSIPQNPDGGIVIPDLSAFHSLIQTRSSAITNGVNEIKLPGTGVGRQLLRYFWRVLNPTAPLAVNATNFGNLGWKYGGNTAPETVTDGQHLRYMNERLFNSDIAAVHGWMAYDFANENAFRDTIDEGAATELRAVIEIGSGVALTTPVVELVQETVFSAAVGA